MKTTHPIDFVIPWVDGNDPAWQAEKAKYSGKTGDSSATRFRDWGTLPYWFRGVEKFAPWVNKVHFITWGHLPEWLNTDHPKLNIVNHKDYIPEKYLPTFSSHPIELNMHRIKGLAEHFVYFNDDTFLIKPVKETDFFRNELPCDTALIKPLNMDCHVSSPVPRNTIRAEINNMFVINHHFNKVRVLKKNIRKFFSPKYRKFLISTFLTLPYPDISGFYIHHLPTSFLKSTFDKVWQDNPEVMDTTCEHKFRFNTDVNQWLVEWYQFCQGNFVPTSVTRGKCYHTGTHFDQIINAISKQKYKMLCCNDSSYEATFVDDMQKIRKAFESILPDKCSFEK